MQLLSVGKIWCRRFTVPKPPHWLMDGVRSVVAIWIVVAKGSLIASMAIHAQATNGFGRVRAVAFVWVMIVIEGELHAKGLGNNKITYGPNDHINA
eukprot:6478197-Amphidinium_carterae.1